MGKVLLVGADEGRIAGIRDALDGDVVLAATTQAAAAILEGGGIDLVVADGASDGVDPFQLALGARENAPGVQLYVVTANDTADLALINDHCVVQYSPSSEDDVSIAVKALSMAESRADSRAPVEDLELLDIIVLACLSRRTAVLYVRHDEHKGRVIFSEGTIPHAEFGERRGADALYEMLALQQGDIFMQNHIDGAYETTIDRDPVQLLSDGLGELEERRVRWAEQSQAESRMSITDSDVHSLMGLEEEDDDERAVAFFSAEELAEIEQLEQAAASISEPMSHSLLRARQSSTPSGPALATPIAQHSGSAWHDSGIRNSVPIAAVTPPPPPNAPARNGDPALPLRPAQMIAPQAPRMTPLPPTAPSASLHELLERMQFEIPGFVATDIVHRGDGLGVATLHALDAYDSAAAAAYYCDFLNACVNAVHGYGAAADLEEVTVTTDAHHIILRPLTGTPFVQMCVVQSDGNLGIARVVLRKYSPLLSLALPH